MWPRLKGHHKVFGPVAGFIVADKTIDTVREHVFLVAHEWVSHHGYLWLTLAGCLGAACVPLAMKFIGRKNPEGE